MNIDEAITHAEIVANTTPCKACADEHRQLAKWLKELKNQRQGEERLKQCPFCGSDEVAIEKTGFKYDPLYYVHCLDCDAAGPTNTREFSVQMWNEVRRD